MFIAVSFLTNCVNLIDFEVYMYTISYIYSYFKTVKKYNLLV